MLAERTIDSRWLRLALFLLPFTPLLIILVPLTTRFVILILCLMYFWPSSTLGTLFQFDFGATLFWVIAALYCAFLGAILSIALSRPFNLFGRVPLRRAFFVLSRTWLPVLCILALLGLDYKGALSFSAKCPARAYILAEFCSDITHFRVASLGGFIDNRHAFHFKSKPKVFARIVREENLVALDPASVPDEFWRRPPWWWNVRRGDGVTVYKSAYFPLEGRGLDGDHYLFIRDTATNRVFALFDSNF